MQNILQAVEAQYLTKAQACVYTGLSERTLDYARERGELRFYRPGKKRVLFKKSELDTWLEKFRVNLEQEPHPETYEEEAGPCS